MAQMENIGSGYAVRVCGASAPDLTVRCGRDARVRQDALFPEGARRTRNLAARASVHHSGKGRGVEPNHA